MKKILLPLLVSMFTFIDVHGVISDDLRNNDTVINNECKMTSNYPYGFFKSFESNIHESKINFKFSYVNTNQNTIKSIKIFFNVKDNNGKTFGNGYFIGDGLIKQNFVGKYRNEHKVSISYENTCYITVTNVILTYEDGEKVILNKKDIKYF